MALLAAIGGVSCAPSAPPAPPAPPAPHVAPAGTRAWLFVADLHFDPFADPALVPRLAALPGGRWKAVFATGRDARGPGFGGDTNEALLEDSLTAMRRVVPDPPVVVIAGDFLAHRFHRLYNAALGRPGGADPDGREPAYRRFMDATIAHLAQRFDAAYPRARFLVAIGNNDGYCGDYESTPRSPFLRAFVRSWAPLVDRDGAAPGFARDFPESGAYEAPLPLPGDRRALVTNSVFWSPAYGNVCAHNDRHQRGDELAWMERTVRAGGPATRWWMLTHIPPGIDAFASVKKLRTVPMYVPGAARDLEDLRLSGGAAFTLVLAGHTHANAFRVMAGAGGPGRTPVAIVPSVTPSTGNAPAFAVGDVAADGTLANVTVYAALGTLGGPDAGWIRTYDFDSAFGSRAFDPDGIDRARHELEVDPATRGRYYTRWISSGGIAGGLEFAGWRREWCAIEAMTRAPYDRCVATLRR